MDRMANLYNRELPPRCEYCLHGRPAPDADAVLCVKRGIMRPDSSCSKFRYDPLKRVPKPKAKVNNDFGPEDFKL